MKRRSIDLTIVVVALLLAGAIALWLWSYSNWSLRVDSGQIVLLVADPATGHDYSVFVRTFHEQQAELFPALRLRAQQDWSGNLGFGVGHGSQDFSMGGGPNLNFRYTLWTMPLWFIVALLAASVAIRWARLRRRWKRATRGQCARCGYDLRATPQKGGALLDRCPECGTAVENLAQG